MNIDLTELPKGEGSRNLYALTTDGAHIGIRLSSGHLEVRSSPRDGTNNFFQMEKILVQQKIFPYYMDQPDPSVFSDLLGLTVKGEKVTSTLSQSGYDLSGKTTYWSSSHLMLSYGNDAGEFVDKVLKAFPDAALIQSKWNDGYKSKKRREISFLIDSDESVLIGIGCSREKINHLLQSTAINENIFPFWLSLGRHSDINKGDLTGELFTERHGGKEANLKYKVSNHRKWGISTQFQTEDDFAQKAMRRLLSILDDHFRHDRQVINIQNGKLIEKHFKRPFEIPSYSINLRDWCLEKTDRYLSIGYESPKTKPYGDLGFSVSDEEIFYGFRPQSLKDSIFRRFMSSK